MSITPSIPFFNYPALFEWDEENLMGILHEQLREFPADDGVGTVIQWVGTPVHLDRELGFDIQLPMTERFFERCFHTLYPGQG
jgi:hypothetical protein